MLFGTHSVLPLQFLLGDIRGTASSSILDVENRQRIEAVVACRIRYKFGWPYRVVLMLKYDLPVSREKKREN